ncbi:MAG TPA: response regulator [Dehalococcoidales bacterium]|nr:response regulator [Dehalococcoidales bacterium]
MENPRKILIIDDESNFVEACQRTLEGKGYQVVTTHNISLAKDLIGGLPDTIVLGTLEPAGQAFALHQWLKQNARFRDIPLMILDSSDRERSVHGWRKVEGLQIEAEEYLTKPMEPAQILPRLMHLLDKSLRKIKVLVADDHTMVRNGICAVLALQKDVEVVGEAANGQDALEKILKLVPDLALMDIVMPVMSGIEATKHVSRECPQTKVLILTQYDEEENMLIARKAGAYGFIPKRSASSDLLTGIRTVYSGEYFPSAFVNISNN